MTKVFDPGKDARKKSREAADQQAILIKQQSDKEKGKLAEQESEVAKRRALIKRSGGRSLLIKTSNKGAQPGGVEKLGG